MTPTAARGGGAAMTLHPFVTHQFEPIWDAYVEANTEDREHDGRLHPSSLFFCDRKVLYDLRMTPRDPTAGSKRPLLVGKVLHEQLQAALSAAVGRGIRELYVEGSVDDPDTGIKGSFDALVLWDDGTWELLELKSANAYSYGLVAKSGEAKEDHVNQGLSYVHVVRTKGFEWAMGFDILGEEMWQRHEPIPELERLRVIYLGKDKHQIKELNYAYTDDWRDGLLRHIDSLNGYRNSDGDLPPRLPRGSWQCGFDGDKGKWCPYFRRCQLVDDAGVEL